MGAQGLPTWRPCHGGQFTWEPRLAYLGEGSPGIPSGGPPDSRSACLLAWSSQGGAHASSPLPPALAPPLPKNEGLGEPPYLSSAITMASKASSSAPPAATASIARHSPLPTVSSALQRPLPHSSLSPHSNHISRRNQSETASRACSEGGGVVKVV